MASQELKLGASGLVTSPNTFTAPDGALAVADNVVVKDAGVVESRRGNALHSTRAGSRLATFQSKLLSLAGTSLGYWNGASWTNYSGAYTQPDSTNKMRFLEAAKNLLFTTNAGIYVLDAYNGTPRGAGLARPLAPTLSTIAGTGANWLPDTHSVAYRVLFTRVDAQGNDIKGAPSYRSVLTNADGAARAVTVAVSLKTPVVGAAMVAAGDHVQLYRSVVSASTPDDEVALSLDYTVSAADVVAGSVTLFDLLPDAQLGAALYTNATQEGAGQENNQPPLARDLCAFRGTVIYANTAIPQLLVAQVTTGAGAYEMLVGDTVTLADGTHSSVYTASSSGPGFLGDPHFKLVSGDPGATALSLVSRINAANTLAVRADYVGGSADAGTFAVEGLALGGPAVSMTFGATAYSLAPGAMQTFVFDSSVHVTQVGHPWVSGCQVTIARVPPGTDCAIPGTYTVTVTDADHYLIGFAADPFTVGANSGTWTVVHNTPAGTQPWRPVGRPGFTSSDSADVAGLSYSKFNQPGAVPFENSDTIGDPSKAILRVLPLRDSVVILKEDGAYRLTGDSPSNFTITPYDPTVSLFAPDSAAVLDDRVFCLTSQGLQVGTESSFEPISGPIQETVLALLANAPTTATKAFAVPYQSEHSYILWLPSVDGDTLCTQAYVLNTRTSTYVRRTDSAAYGLIDPSVNKLILTDGTSVLSERKDYATTDYQDVGGTATITGVTDSTHVTMSGPIVGDLITQGIYTAHVLSVGAANALTLDTAGTWTVASATYARAIDCKVQWLPATGGNPGTTKQFMELALNFRLGQFLWLHVGFFTDVSPTAETSLRYGKPSKPVGVNVRTLMPQNMARGTQLNIYFEHQQALCNFRLQSASLVYREVSSRTPSHGAP